MSISGSCVCGGVQCRVNSDPKAVVNCHCNFCRSHSGGAFSSYIVVPEDALEVVVGEGTLSSYEIKEGARKHFCRQCGTPVYNKNAKYAGLCMIYLGTVKQAADCVPTANIYCESQLAWVTHIGEIRSFPQGIARQVK